MAISKERFEELIKQGATIYEAKYGRINPVSTKHKIRGVYKDMITFEPPMVGKYSHHKYFNRLFETREEAQEYLEFGNITRTEKLMLPTWNKIKNEKGIYDVQFLSYDGDDCDLIINFVENKISVLGVGGAYDFWDLTKENYDEARKLCVKLFKGESK